MYEPSVKTGLANSVSSVQEACCSGTDTFGILEGIEGSSEPQLVVHFARHCWEDRRQEHLEREHLVRV